MMNLAQIARRLEKLELSKAPGGGAPLVLFQSEWEETGVKHPTDAEIQRAIADAVRTGRIRDDRDVVLFRDFYEAAPQR